MDKIYIGIDPGKDGALAVIWNDGKAYITPFDPCGEEGYRDELETVARAERATICCLEKVGAMPGQGVTSMFSFGQNFGFIQGLLVANRIPYELRTPQKWKKEFSLNKDKGASIREAHRLFPNVSLKRTDKCRSDHDGMAEALLMAEYARRNL